MVDENLEGNLKEWQKRAEEIFLEKRRLETEYSNLKNEAEEMECALRVECDHLKASVRIHSEILKNIEELAPIIVSKRQLEHEISLEKKKIQEAEEVHQEKVSARRSNAEFTFEEQKKKHESAKSKGLEKVKKAAQVYQKEMRELNEEFEKTSQELELQESKHLKKKSDLDMKHQEERDHLKRRIDSLEKDPKKNATPDKDHIRMVHDLEQGFEAKLSEMDKKLECLKIQIVKEKEELFIVHEALRHQEQLNIVRDVTTCSRKASDVLVAEDNQMLVDSSQETKDTFCQVEEAVKVFTENTSVVEKERECKRVRPRRSAKKVLDKKIWK